MLKVENKFVKKIEKYLHPEATEFYRQVERAINTLKSIKDEIYDPESLFTRLGYYPFYAFENNKNYTTWVKDKKKIYSKVSNFDDLLTTNILFLHGLMPTTYYHLSPIYDMDVSKLVAITQHFKYFTTDGQSSECNDQTKQKAYLEGIIHNDYLYDLITELEKQDGYYYGYYNIASKEIKTNLPFTTLTADEWKELRDEDDDDDEDDYQQLNDENKLVTFYNVTLEINSKTNKIEIPDTNIRRDSLQATWDDIAYSYLPPKVIQDIQSNCSVLHIYGKEYCEGNIEDLLYRFIK
jgi:hypothetical protein